MSAQWWVYIERDDGPDLALGPYPDEAAAARAGQDSLLVEYLLSPAGGGGTECSWSTDQPTDKHDQHIIDMADPNHTGQPQDEEDS